MQQAQVTAEGDLRHRIALSVVLLVLVFAAFWPGLQAYFVIIDDADYVFANGITLSGLNAKSVAWAFKSTEVANNWQPITWLSHMLDVELYDQEASGHHLTSIVIHAINAVLLFAILRSATGALWPSFLAAALFAVHPLRVESVVWISERKDVLSTFFGLLSTAAYFRYQAIHSVGRYALVALWLALALMSKPTFVTLPALFLLLDYWPLRRVGAVGAPFDWRGAVRLVVEKLPLLGLSLASAVITILAQKNALDGGSDVSVAGRLINAVMSYAIYLFNFAWPTDLSPFYAHPNLPGGVPWSVFELGASALTLFAITVVVARSRSHPYLLVGWLWYVVALLPMIGLLQAGLQARADRYTYLPSIGLSIAVAWWLAYGMERWVRSRAARALAGSLGAGVLIALTASSFLQSRYWENSTTMLARSLQYSPNSAFIHTNAGYYLAYSDNLEGGLKHLERALVIDPTFVSAHSIAGAFLARADRLDEAIAHYQAILELRPNDEAASKSIFDIRMRKTRPAVSQPEF